MEKGMTAVARAEAPVTAREEKPARQDAAAKVGAMNADAQSVSGMAGTAAEPGEISMTAPMPGIIIACKVSEGEPIKAGDIVVVLEAMKMENDLASPADGTMKKITCTPGASVKKDDLLCIISTRR
jgi:biotin carboxyl carrier protein